jgi:hypothetical protein
LLQSSWMIAPQKLYCLNYLPSSDNVVSSLLDDDSVSDTDTSQLKHPDVPKNQRVGVLGPRSPKYVLTIAAVKGHMYA